ncbi:TPA: hypothetical protein N2779_004452 [Vibrio parahaemolyticus]|nr:hypothetical protein [Vibrio parahaemolyticus]
MDSNSIDKKVQVTQWAALFVLVLSVAVYIYWFWYVNGQGISTDSTVWGAFGDFVGGLLNPIIALSALYWLTVSVKVQKQELAEARESLIDTVRGQKQQTKLLMLSSQMNALSKEVDSLNVDLASEYAFRQHLIAQASTQKGNNTILAYDGEAGLIEEEFISINIRINKLVERRSYVQERLRALSGQA